MQSQAIGGSRTPLRPSGKGRLRRTAPGRPAGALALAALTAAVLAVVAAVAWARPEARVATSGEPAVAKSQNPSVARAGITEANTRAVTTSAGAAHERAPRAENRRAAAASFRPGPVVARADEQGRVTLRFRFSPAGRDWTRHITSSLVVRGSSGSVARHPGEEAWPEGVGRGPAVADPWETVRQDRMRLVERSERRIRRMEARLTGGGLSASAARSLERTIESERALVSRERAALARNGCSAGDRPEIVAEMTLALGERLFLGCHFKPGERVRADLAFNFTGQTLPNLTVEDLKRVNSERRRGAP